MKIDLNNMDSLKKYYGVLETKLKERYDECVKDWFSAIDIFRELYVIEPSDFLSHYMYAVHGTFDFDETDMEWLNLEHIVKDKALAPLEGIEWVRLPQSISTKNASFYKDSYDGFYHITYHSFETIRIKPKSETLKYIQDRLNSYFIFHAINIFQNEQGL